MMAVVELMPRLVKKLRNFPSPRFTRFWAAASLMLKPAAVSRRL
jgi:hypothetical protein